MWVRSQDKKILMKVDNINLGIDVDTEEPNRLFTFVGGTVTSFTLGTYNSKERALEVLDEIHTVLLMKDTLRLNSLDYKVALKVFSKEELKEILTKTAVYQMPEK